MSHVLELDLRTTAGQGFARLQKFSIFQPAQILDGVEFVFEFGIIGNDNAAAAELSLTEIKIDLDVIVEQMEARMARSISQGSGLAPTLERRYGLNPAAGAMR